MAVLVLWLHLVAAALWVGPQLYMFVAIVPALRHIRDPQVRRRVTLALSNRYGILSWISMAALVVTGLLLARSYALS